MFVLAGSLTAWADTTFLAVLSGGEEVPANNSRGRGVTILQLDEATSTVHYKLIVANIHNVVAAHIHRGGAGTNGPVVIPLFGGPTGGGRFNGILSEGSFTATPELLDEMANGLSYVNVHTNDGVDPPGTGPGDLPGGEIRGQVFVADDED
jgi:hypothetical protein